MRPQQVVNALKIAEELSDLEVKYQVINDNIEWAERGMFQVNKPKAREISTRRGRIRTRSICGNKIHARRVKR